MWILSEAERRPCAEESGLDGLIPAARDMRPVSGLTHNFYRYPARFSPSFVRAVILELSEPGDWVMDPFAGGGTTLVAALAAGRNALGIDISALAYFICEAKTPRSSRARDTDALRRWIRGIPKTINMHTPGHHFTDYAEAGYYRNIVSQDYWRIRKAIEQVLVSAMRLRSKGARTLARCVVLRTAQWALDARKIIPSVSRFRKELMTQAKTMLSSGLDFRICVEQYPPNQRPKAICLNRTSAGLEDEPLVARISASKTCGHVTSISWHPHALSQMAGRRSQGDTGPILDRQPA